MCVTLAGKRSDEFYDLGGVVIGPVVHEVSGSAEFAAKRARSPRSTRWRSFCLCGPTQEPRRLVYSWCRAAIVSDHPDKGLPPAPKTETHPRDKLAKAGDRMKTTKDFIRGSVGKSFLSGKLYLVRFVEGHAQPAGEWLRARLAEVRGNKR
jgi:hypothetical protein